MKLEGNMFLFWIITLGWAVLAGITFGLTAPLWLFWTVKYFIDNTKV